MAQLERLNKFDAEWRAAREDLMAYQRLMASNPKMWTDEQQAALGALFGGVAHLLQAVTEVVHNNR